jgi:hypothetical protein
MDTASMMLADFQARGIRLIPDPPKLSIEPASKLTDKDRGAIRQHKAELLALLMAEPVDLPSPLLVIADAIAACPRSPCLNDLALSHAAATYVAAERMAHAASPSLRGEVHKLVAETLLRVADEIRAARYMSADNLMDDMAEKVRQMRGH